MTKKKVKSVKKEKSAKKLPSLAVVGATGAVGVDRIGQMRHGNQVQSPVVNAK